MRRLSYPQSNRRILRRAVRIRVEPEYCDACMEAFQAQVDNERPGHVWTIINGHVAYREDLIMAAYLGRPLKSNEIVVHRNADPTNNDMKNLAIVELPEEEAK